MRRSLFLTAAALVVLSGCAGKPKLDRNILTTVTHDIPLPPGSEPFTTEIEQGQPRIIARLSQTEEAIRQFYLEELPKEGWIVTEKRKTIAGLGMTGMTVRRKGSPSYQIVIGKGAGLDLKGNEISDDLLITVKALPAGGSTAPS